MARTAHRSVGLRIQGSIPLQSPTGTGYSPPAQHSDTASSVGIPQRSASMPTGRVASEPFQQPEGPRTLPPAMERYLGQPPKDGGSTWEISQEFVRTLEGISSTKDSKNDHMSILIDALAIKI